MDCSHTACLSDELNRALALADQRDDELDLARA
jgi:hypothetical protein